MAVQCSVVFVPSVCRSFQNFCGLFVHMFFLWSHNRSITTFDMEGLVVNIHDGSRNIA